MRRNTILFICILTSLVFGLPKEAEADPVIASNFTLADGSQGFFLDGRPIKVNEAEERCFGGGGGAGGGRGCGFVVGFNPRSGNSIGNPDLMPTLDLSNVGNPVLNNPSTGSQFSIFWGLYRPDPGGPSIRFTSTSPTPTALGTPKFTFHVDASDGNQDLHSWFTVTGPTYLDLNSWVSVPSGNPDLPGVQFNFSFATCAVTTCGDPTLSFSVYENDQQLIFAAVPEPETYAMLLAGLGLLGFMAKRRKLKEAAAA